MWITNPRNSNARKLSASTKHICLARNYTSVPFQRDNKKFTVSFSPLDFLQLCTDISSAWNITHLSGGTETARVKHCLLLRFICRVTIVFPHRSQEIWFIVHSVCTLNISRHNKWPVIVNVKKYKRIEESSQKKRKQRKSFCWKENFLFYYKLWP